MWGHLRVGALVCKPLGVLVGFVYPAFQSWKALEGANQLKGEAAVAGGAPSQSQSAWLTYWVVFSLFNVVEHLADVLVSWIPFYYIAKLAFVIWLQAPQTRGASVLQVHYITPLLHKHESAIDNVIEDGMKKGSATFMEFRTRSEQYFRGSQGGRTSIDLEGSAADRNE